MSKPNSINNFMVSYYVFFLIVHTFVMERMQVYWKIERYTKFTKYNLTQKNRKLFVWFLFTFSFRAPVLDW